MFSQYRHAAFVAAQHLRMPQWVRLADPLARFKREEDGNVAILFGLMLTSMCLMIGGSVDMGRWLNARGQTFAAIDAAVLAAGRAVQTGAANDAAVTLAKRVYKSNIKNRIKVATDNVEFSVEDEGARIATHGKVTVKTPFLSFVNIESLPLYTPDEAPEATTAQNRYQRFNREVSLMLDVSGSMCSPCDKRDDMKAAAKDLVNILMKNNTSSEFKARLSVVPFSGDVRPPVTMLPVVTDPTLPTYISTSVKSGRKTKYYYYYKSLCVGERTGTNRYTDAAPGAGSYVLAAYSNSSWDDYCSIGPTNTVLPLTYDMNTVLARIDGLQTGGMTAGHVGTAWAYYMLSPNWGNAVGLNAKAAEYGTDNLKKIAILMTDGEYNQERDSRGLSVDDAGSGNVANGASSSQQAIQICQKMKESGIEVYTVGFDLGGNSTAINTLEQCASSDAHSYLASSGEQLKQAFRDIAVKLTELYVSN